MWCRGQIQVQQIQAMRPCALGLRHVCPLAVSPCHHSQRLIDPCRYVRTYTSATLIIRRLQAHSNMRVAEISVTFKPNKFRDGRVVGLQGFGLFLWVKYCSRCVSSQIATILSAWISCLGDHNPCVFDGFLIMMPERRLITPKVGGCLSYSWLSDTYSSTYSCRRVKGS